MRAIARFPAARHRKPRTCYQRNSGCYLANYHAAEGAPRSRPRGASPSPLLIPTDPGSVADARRSAFLAGLCPGSHQRLEIVIASRQRRSPRSRRRHGSPRRATRRNDDQRDDALCARRDVFRVDAQCSRRVNGTKVSGRKGRTARVRSQVHPEDDLGSARSPFAAFGGRRQA